MKRKRYSQDQIEFLEQVLKAALDIVDGIDCVDLQEFTGLPQQRCQEILSLLNIDWPKWWNQ